MWKAPVSLLALLAFGLVGWAQAGAPGPDPATPPAVPKRSPSAARLANAAEVRKRLGLLPEYERVSGVESLKIAVLDHGFDGIDSGRPYLPENAVVVEHYDPEFVRRFGLGDPDYRKAFEPLNHHGRTMAQLVWALTGFHPGGPKFYLLNANGPTMLRRAVRYAIQEKVDVLLFSGDFEGGGNGDGRGPINRIVADALAADILWINAAGNYGHCVYNGPVRLDRDGYLRFRDGPDGTALRFRNRLDENTVTVTLTWNDYREQEDAGTDKDLDLYVEDWSGKRLGASEKTQVSGVGAPGPNESRNPRERVVLTDLPANLDFNYRIRVRAKKSNFTANDRIRVLVTASRDVYVDPATNTSDDAVTFFDATGKGELYPPADNPLVVTVGDSSPASAAGPTADHRRKPDVVLEDSRAFFSDGEVSAGSSNAAAYFAGIVAVLKAAEPGLRTRHLLDLAQQAAPAPRTAARGLAGSSILRSRSLPEMERYPVASRSQSPPYPEEPLRSSGRTYRSYSPPPYSPQPGGSGRTVVIGPLGRMLIFRSLPYPAERDLADPSFRTARRPSGTDSAEVLPSPRQPSAAAETSSPLAGGVWRTPSRARLAEIVRTNR